MSWQQGKHGIPFLSLMDSIRPVRRPYAVSEQVDGNFIVTVSFRSPAKDVPNDILLIFINDTLSPFPI